MGQLTGNSTYGTRSGVGGTRTPVASTPRVAATPTPQIGGYKAKDAYVNGRALSSGGFPDDGARRMPSLNDPVLKENERLLANMMQRRFGRTATDLTGTRSYVNTYLGSTR